MDIDVNALEQERKSLLVQWKDAKDNEKVQILVRIMDIDEQLEQDKLQKSLSLK